MTTGRDAQRPDRADRHRRDDQPGPQHRTTSWRDPGEYAPHSAECRNACRMAGAARGPGRLSDRQPWRTIRNLPFTALPERIQHEQLERSSKNGAAGGSPGCAPNASGGRPGARGADGGRSAAGCRGRTRQWARAASSFDRPTGSRRSSLSSARSATPRCSASCARSGPSTQAKMMRAGRELHGQVTRPPSATPTAAIYWPTVRRRDADAPGAAAPPAAPSSAATLDEIERRYRAMIDDARDQGYDVAADNLEHWLQGSGSTRKIDVAWLRGFAEVTEAEQVNRQRFEKSLTKKAQGLKDGETVAFTDHWDRQLTASVEKRTLLRQRHERHQVRRDLHASAARGRSSRSRARSATIGTTPMTGTPDSGRGSRATVRSPTATPSFWSRTAAGAKAAGGRLEPNCDGKHHD